MDDKTEWDCGQTASTFFENLKSLINYSRLIIVIDCHKQRSLLDFPLSHCLQFIVFVRQRFSSGLDRLPLFDVPFLSYTQDFCKPNNWPPIKELRVTKSQDGQSCVFACLDKGHVCEPTFFTSINTIDALKRYRRKVFFSYCSYLVFT